MAATPSPVSTLFTEYYTANPIADTTVDTDFNPDEEPIYVDITADGITDYNQQLATGCYSQALTDADDVITTQWGLQWAMVLQTTAWTATSTAIYTQYFSPEYATGTDLNYANYVCQAVNVDDQNSINVLSDGAAVTTVMQATDVNWSATFTADQAESSPTATTVTEVQALGTAFTYTGTPDDAWTYGSVDIDDTATWQLVFECYGVRPVDALSDDLDELVEGELSFNAGAIVFTSESDLTELYHSVAATDFTQDIVQGAASLAAAATAVAVSLALF